MKARRFLIAAPYLVALFLFVLLTVLHHPRAATLSLLLMVPSSVYMAFAQGRQ